MATHMNHFIALSKMTAEEVKRHARLYGIDTFGMDAEEMRAAIIEVIGVQLNARARINSASHDASAAIRSV